MAADKSRFFDFLVYDESAPDDWVGILRRSHCAFAISPIHQPDDECKKPHYHVVFYSGNGPITLQAAKSKIPAEVPPKFPESYDEIGRAHV